MYIDQVGVMEELHNHERLVEQTLKTKTAQEWEDIFNEAGVPAMRIRTALVTARSAMTCS